MHYVIQNHVQYFSKRQLVQATTPNNPEQSTSNTTESDITISEDTSYFGNNTFKVVGGGNETTEEDTSFILNKGSTTYEREYIATSESATITESYDTDITTPFYIRGRDVTPQYRDEDESAGDGVDATDYFTSFQTTVASIIESIKTTVFDTTAQNENIYGDISSNGSFDGDTIEINSQTTDIQDQGRYQIELAD